MDGRRGGVLSVLRANAPLDPAPPELHAARVLEKRVSRGKHTSYDLALGPWGPGPPATGPLTRRLPRGRGVSRLLVPMRRALSALALAASLAVAAPAAARTRVVADGGQPDAPRRAEAPARVTAAVGRCTSDGVCTVTEVRGKARRARGVVSVGRVVRAGVTGRAPVAAAP